MSQSSPKTLSGLTAMGLHPSQATLTAYQDGDKEIKVMAPKCHHRRPLLSLQEPVSQACGSSAAEAVPQSPLHTFAST